MTVSRAVISSTPESDFVLGIDIGTTAVKALLLDCAKGTYLASSSDEYPLYSDHPGWAEADPMDWIMGVKQAIARLNAHSNGCVSKVKGISVCGMIPALVAITGDGSPVRRSIQQNDARTMCEITEIENKFDPEDIYKRTGSTLNQQHILPKLLWLKKHEPDVFAKAAMVVGSYDFIRAWLTGNYGIEANWAVESGLYDVAEKRWIDEYLVAFGLSPNLFPTIGQPWEFAGKVTHKVGSELNIPAGTPVIFGSADHVASALAAGVETEGDLLIKFGGAGDILFCTEKAVFHRKLYFDLHDIKDRYLLNGCMASSGSLVRWLLTLLKTNEGELWALDKKAEQIGPGSDGIVVLPYFLGEKTPIFNPQARGVIFGLMLHHRDEHLFRAVLESVIFGFRHHIEILESSGYQIDRVFATNGGARSELWRQIASDVLQREIIAFPGHPGSALGAAIVVGRSLGLLSGTSVTSQIKVQAVKHTPNPMNRSRYDNLYHIYRELYERNIDLFTLIDERSSNG